MAHNLPHRSEIRSKLTALIHDQCSRAEVSAWAMQIIDDDDVSVDDPVAWDVIKSLGGADLNGLDRPYLYDREDFEAWARKLSDS